MRVASCAPYCTPAGWYCWPAGWYYMAGIPLSKRCCGTLEIRDSFTDTVHRDEVYTVTPRGTSGAMKHAFLPQVDTMMMAWCNSGACGRGDLEQWDAVSIGARRDRYGQNLKSATSVSIFAPCCPQHYMCTHVCTRTCAHHSIPLRSNKAMQVCGGGRYSHGTNRGFSGWVQPESMLRAGGFRISRSRGSCR